jgi:hypothetical protein
VHDVAGGCVGSDVAKRAAQQDLGKLQTAGESTHGLLNMLVGMVCVDCMCFWATLGADILSALQRCMHEV